MNISRMFGFVPSLKVCFGFAVFNMSAMCSDLSLTPVQWILAWQLLPYVHPLCILSVSQYVCTVKAHVPAVKLHCHTSNTPASVSHRASVGNRDDDDDDVLTPVRSDKVTSAGVTWHGHTKKNQGKHGGCLKMEVYWTNQVTACDCGQESKAAAGVRTKQLPAEPSWLLIGWRAAWSR